MPFTQEDIEKLFTYRQWTDAEVAKFKPLRLMAMAYAEAVREIVPPCPEQTLAIRSIHNASILVNTAITLHPEETPAIRANIPGAGRLADLAVTLHPEE